MRFLFVDGRISFVLSWNYVLWTELIEALSSRLITQQQIDGFESHDEAAMLLHKTIANYGSLDYNMIEQMPRGRFSLLFCALTWLL